MWRPVAWASALAAVLGWLGCWKPPGATPSVDPATTSSKTEAMADYLSALQWLVGTWSSKQGGEQVSEEWIRVHPRLMLGSNRTVVDGELTGYEHLEIWVRGGDVIYRAKPEDQPPVEFALVELAEDRAVFENPRHDFPRRIVYQLRGDALEASISGELDGSPAERSWTWEREPDTGPREYVLKSVVVDAPIAEVFEAFTSAGQAETFFAPEARIEPRAGGAYELYFVPEAPVGSRGGEGCTIVEIKPPGLVSFTWNFPPDMPTLRDAHTLVTVRVSPFGDGKARVDFKQEGFRGGADWEEGRAYFERAWGIVLDRLQQRFKSGPFDWDE